MDKMILLKRWRGAPGVVRRPSPIVPSPLRGARYMQQNASDKSAIINADTKPHGLSRIFKTDAGKGRKTLIVAVLFTLWIVLDRGDKAKWTRRMHFRLRMCNTFVKTLNHIDRHSYQQTDFSDYLSTLAHYRKLILVSHWTHSIPWDELDDIPDILSTEDFTAIRETVDPIFAQYAVLPDSPQRQAFHRKIRSTSHDLHEFLHDFRSSDGGELAELYNCPVEEMSMDGEMTIMALGFACHILLKTSWWLRPRRIF